MTSDSSVREARYAALTDETRIQILLTLADQYEEAWSSEWPTFSELREQVGVDDTSRFSYHLSELQETFIQKVDGRYRPQVAALEIVSAIRAGSYNKAASDGEQGIARQETAYDCPHCDQHLIAVYQNHQLYIGCPDHGAAVAYPSPPQVAETRTLQEIIDSSLQKHACDVRLLRDGVCPHCWGAASLSFPRQSVPASYLYQELPYATAECDACWVSYPIPLAHTILGHHAVETLYAEHGLGPRDAQIGPYDLAAVSQVSISDGELPTAQVTVRVDDEELVVSLNESCSVLDSQRL
ncbi:helix-turn-helix transcriptional regulator [Halorubrum sp. RMP-47]|uniref:Helix-turn-helix transcriptional regulator n=1 Tax=Halorubrum miltondacostae TaxID=3076378 RepID=A0ABD5M9U8_9EURY